MGTEEDKTKGSPPPHVELQLQEDGLIIRWGPPRGRWGVYNENDAPEEVEIFKWHLCVSEKPPGKGAKSSNVPTDPFYTGTETKIPIKKLKNREVTVQVIGVFKSRDLKGKPFDEGIYSDPVEVAIK